jgi:hypothetical protein
MHRGEKLDKRGEKRYEKEGRREMTWIREVKRGTRRGDAER